MPRITISIPEKTPQPYRFQLDRQTVTFGRGSENDILIECASVSVKHATMQRVEGGYELRDSGSTNGIKQDGVRKEVITLRNGMTATLGDVSFDFLLTDEEVEALSQESPLAGASSPPESSNDKLGLPPLPPVDFPSSYELVEKKEGGSGFFWVLLFILMAMIAFFFGMVIHFRKDTGGSLIDAIKGKSEAIQR